MKGRGSIKGSLGTTRKTPLYRGATASEWNDRKFGRSVSGWDKQPGFDQTIWRTIGRTEEGIRRPSPSRTDPSTRRS